MGIYTDKLRDHQYNISMDEDDLKKHLIDVVKSFRSFDEALDEFIQGHGYNSDLDNIKNKIRFIKTKFKETNVPIPRNINYWYSEHKPIERKTGYQFCFAFQLNIEETKEFFRKVVLERCFDYHSINELVYYYCLSNELSYSHALELIERSPKIIQGKIPEHKIYTGELLEAIYHIHSDEELIEFFYLHQNDFAYNNVTSYQFIQRLWEDIDSSKSTWETYLHILGLDEKDFEDGKPKITFDNRSIKSYLTQSDMIHPLAIRSFPDRQTIEAILRGDHKSHEAVRKTLILLVFYVFFKDRTVQYGDTDRCISTINHHLDDAYYQPLYEGNPFDWLFMFVANENNPLEAFRDYMRGL